MVKEFQAPKDLLLYLVSAAEDVSIVLLEPSDASQAREGPADLITMKDAKVCETYWQLFVGMSLILEHETVARAVHWLEPECLSIAATVVVLMFYHEEILFVVLVVP